MAIPPEDASPHDERHIAGSMTGVLLRCLRAQFGGDDTVTRVLDAAGERRSVAELESLETWSSYQQVLDLFVAAAEITGDPEIGRHSGAHLMLEYHGTAIEALLRSLGSPGEVLRNIAQTAAKFSTILRMEPLEVGDTGAVVTAEYEPGFYRHPVLCGYTQGVLSQTSALFGMDLAVVTETQCQGKGADRCIYHVSWDPASATANLQRLVEHLEGELATLTTRFEALQHTATDLVEARDVEQLLGTITHRAADTVRAPHHLLAVRVAENAPLHVHARGIADDELDTIVAEVLADQPDDRGGARLIVDVVSHARHYGRLAAIYPDGSCFLPSERQLLTAYAGHAAAALEAAAAREEAERRNDTARALLQLAASLAEVGTQAEVAARIGDAVPSVVECEAAGVFLWNRADEVLRLAAVRGIGSHDANVLGDARIAPTADPVLARVLHSEQPVIVPAADLASPFDRFVSGTAATSLAIVPIRHRAELYGVITAAVVGARAGWSDDAHLLERLAGIAHHASTALLNARLLEQVRFQATHDGLTGLPNRMLLRDRAEHGVADARRRGASVALVFVDLDGFKAVNDNFGHGVGDELLVQVGDRLSSLVRASDTVARLGGDEFAVLLPDVGDAATIERLAAMIAADLRRPYDIDDHEVVVSASVGISVLQPDDDYEAFLKRADLAMYEAKRAR